MKNKLNFLYGWIELLILVVIDQFTKYLAVFKLKAQQPFTIIKNVLELHYLENKGAAWGMLENARFLFIFITIVLLTIIIFYYRRIPCEPKWNICRALIFMLTAGAIGNLIDRVLHGYVVDFIYFKIIDFPIFNLADCYVTIAITLFIIIYRKEIIQWIRSES